MYISRKPTHLFIFSRSARQIEDHFRTTLHNFQKKLALNSGISSHAHADDTTAVIHSQTECNTLLNRGKRTIISHPKATPLRSPFRQTAKERYLGVILHRGGRLSVPPSSLDRILNTLSTARKLRISHLGRMNIVNGYARPVLLFPLTATKDHRALNQMEAWEKWFLSPDNTPFNNNTSYRNQVKPERLHPLTWGNLPPLHLQLHDRRQTLARKHPTWSPIKWGALPIPKSLQWKLRTDAEIPLTKGQKDLAEDGGVVWREIWQSWRHLPLRAPIRSFLWKLNNRIIPTLPGNCPTCNEPLSQDHIFYNPSCHIKGPTMPHPMQLRLASPKQVAQ